jgi:hypothetical protein
MGCLGCKSSIPLSVQKAMNKEAEKKKNQKTTRIHIDFAVITARPADAATPRYAKNPWSRGKSEKV